MSSLVLVTALAAFSWATPTSARPALPGTVNYIEGNASLDSETLHNNSIGSADLQAGQTLTTGDGRAEILLTPGVFLRMDSNSAVKMVSPSILDTRLDVNQGDALIEVAELHPENDIRITQDGSTARLLKTGLYDFDAAHQEMRVLDGKAVVQEGDREITVKGGRQLALNEQFGEKPQKFNKNQYEQGDLYRWSSLRSSYLAEANLDSARIYVANGWYGPGWIGAGWYWNPWFSAYTFIPGSGIFYSPFGWGFYSPLLAYRVGFFGGYGYHHFSAAYRPPAEVHGFDGAPVGGLHAQAFGGLAAGAFGVRR